MSIIYEKSTQKRIIAKMIFAFFAVIAMLTFFSKTINNYSLPIVKVECPVNGRLLTEIICEGQVKEKEIIDIFSKSTRWIESIKVNIGDNVNKGDVLITFSKEELIDELQEEEIKLKQYELALKKLELGNYTKNGDNYIKKINTADKKRMNVKEKLKNVTELYQSGAETKENVKQYEDELYLAELEYELSKSEYEAFLGEERRRLENIRIDIENKNLDIQLHLMKINSIKAEIDNESVIISPCQGIIKELNYSIGSITNNSTPLCTISNIEKGFELVVDIDSQTLKMLSVGDEVEISFAFLSDSVIYGKIKTIKDKGIGVENKKAYVEFLNDEYNSFSGDEKGEIYISKRSAYYNTLVNKNALGEDSDGKFVYILNENSGSFGKEYHVTKTNVNVENSDNRRAAIISGITREDKVIVSSDKALEDGMRVRLIR